MSVKTLSVFGATGSVGTSVLDVVAFAPNRYKVHTLTAYSDYESLAARALSLAVRPARVVIGQTDHYAALKSLLSGSGIEVAAGRKALLDAAKDQAVDCFVAAIVGMAGLEPLLCAIEGGVRSVAIANKEPLVAAGALVMAKAQAHGCRILPLDSEHNAIFQVFEEENREGIVRLILTASGGPFRTWPLEQMRAATPAQAVAHPNWSMGAKISVDSASMMNKALEVIEAHHLFQIPAQQIDVLLHPQSIVHSMVEYADGSVLAQMGCADMRVPIAQALAWPERLAGPGARLDFLKIPSLTFEPVDPCRFPAINLAYEALERGQAACIAMNAANEVAVEAFLAGRIGFCDITLLARRALETIESKTDMAYETIFDLSSVLFCDEQVRLRTEQDILSGQIY